MNTSIQERGFSGIDPTTGCAACHRFWIGSKLRGFPLVAALLISMTCVFTCSTYGQSCHPAAVNYILRDDGHGGPCQLKFADATLEYHGKKMRLIFDVDIPSTKQPVLDMVIDSLPFQEGTFHLDLSGLASDDHRVMAATRWKRISAKSEE